jgi:DNA-binding SARP family transcriptional activator
MIPFSLRRNVERVRSSSAQVVMLIAPAGFGKTTIAEALCADYASNFAVCDCSEVTTAKEFLHSVIAALGKERAFEEVWFSQIQLELAGVEAENDRIDLLDRAWQKGGERRSLFVFENCEAVLRDVNASTLLRRLVSTAPSSRRIVVCSRTPLSIHAGRALPPHCLLLLTTKDLALSDEEARSIVVASPISPERQDRIIALAHGWPVVLLLLKRLAEEGKLEGALQNAYNVAFDDLFPYLYQEVLSPLPSTLRRAATVCAAVPDITSAELRMALGDKIMTALDLRSVPLLEVRDDRYVIHPFVRELLLKEEPQWRDVVHDVAQAAEAENRSARAAKLYRISNDLAGAARALAKLSLDDLLAPAAALELASMPPTVIREYPKLALTFLQHTRITRQLQVVLDQAFEKALTTETPGVIVSVASAAIEANHWLGSLERSRRIMNHPELRHTLRSSPQLEVGSLLGAEQVLGVLEGAIESNVDALYAAYQESLTLPLAFRSSILAAYIAYAERWRGRRDASIEMIEQSVAHALGSKYPLIVIGTLAEAFTNAWFWGDDALASRYRRLLASWREESAHDVRSLPLFTSGEPEEMDAGTLPSTAAVFPFFVAAAEAADPRKRSYYLHRAQMRAFADGGLLMTRVATLLAQAAEASKDRDTLARALDLVNPKELPYAREAILALMQGKPSFFAPFMERFLPSVPVEAPMPAKERIAVSVLTESVHIDGKQVIVSPREAACLACLARQRSGVAREELQEAIWPDLSESAARDALYSLLYRLRKRAGDFELIENIGNAYRYTNKAVIDLWEMEDAAQRCRRGMPPPIEEVERAYEMLERRSWPHLLQFDWFPALEFRIKEAGRTLVRHLIESAFKSQNYSSALAHAHKLLLEDECDEWAHEMIIRAHLGLGNRIEAIRAYRGYVQLVKREVGSMPSADLQAFAERHALTENRAAS